MRPPEEVKRELVRQWIGKAEQDLKAVESLPKTHDFDELPELISRVDKTLAEQLGDATLFTPYGVGGRYRGDLPEPDARPSSKSAAITSSPSSGWDDGGSKNVLTTKDTWPPPSTTQRRPGAPTRELRSPPGANL
jgi:hypothetical protein